MKSLEILVYLFLVIATPYYLADRSQQEAINIVEGQAFAQSDLLCTCYAIHEKNKPKLLYPVTTCDELTAASIDTSQYLTQVYKVKCSEINN